MSDEDRVRWDRRYAERGQPVLDAVGPPRAFASFEDDFPVEGRALDLACGQGVRSLWLAGRGLTVLGVDVSPTAISHARDLAQRSECGDRCRFDVVDLDAGLPAGEPVNVLLCNRFRDRRLDDAIIARLAPGGLLGIVAVSEVGGTAGSFRSAPGELTAAFAELDVITAGEGDGEAWLLAQR